MSLGPTGPMPSVSTPGPAPQRRPPPRRWLRMALAAAVLVAVIIVTAAVTYALARQPAAPTPATASPAPPTTTQGGHHSFSEQDAAKERVCHVFDESTRGQQGEGGVRPRGQINVPLVLRTLNGVLAIEEVLTPATPQEVSAPARKYITTSLDLTTAAMDPRASAAELDHLNDVSNDAIDQFLAACGLE